MKKITKDKLSLLWEKINQNYELFLPIKEKNVVNFSIWEEGDEVDLDILKTVTSPKSIIFPQTETYLEFKKAGKKLVLETVGGKKEEYVLFGARPCDVASFKILDNVFLNDPVDKFYEDRRNKGLIISQACCNPEETCFCNSFGINPELASEGVDVTTWDLGNILFWEAQSEKGKELTEALAAILEDVTAADRKRLSQLKNEIKGKLKDLPLANIAPEIIEGSLKEIFAAEVWDELYKRCLGCGMCTYVCPTCHCYDLQDYDGNKCGERFRCWDSCMSSDFTMMAHGNPRTTQKERVRQRFMHKLVYYLNNYNSYACVGCGRCTEKCPVSLDMIKVIKKLGGEINEL